jgi:hypothetical protein
MKKATIIGMILAVAVNLYSQEREYKTLVDFDQVRISGMGGPVMQFTAIDGEFAHLMGGGGAILFNDFFIGGYGLGMTNNIRVNKDKYPGAQTDHHLSVSHGGFWLGYSLFGTRPVHVCISSLVGWGELGIKDDYGQYDGDNFFTIVPTLEVELNLTRYFRIGAGATYNLYTLVDLKDPSDPDAPGYKSSDLSSPGGFLSFKFGWF